MLGRDGYPTGVPCWIDIAAADPAAMAAFYGGVFGWALADKGGAEAPYLVATLAGRRVAGIGSPCDAQPDAPAWTTYVAVERTDDAAAAVRDAGGTVLVEPFDFGRAGRAAVCADPSGAIFALWQAGRRKGAEIVNAPGSWNWSDLHTPEPDAAIAFYGAAFGWEASSVDVGGMAATMWRRPGYGEVLERYDPGLRQRHEEFGAPPGFADAIAWIEPLPAGETPSWRVTFSVDDADATVERAVRLGGAVVAGPFEAGGFARVATLRDPQGAVFVVSEFLAAES